MVDDADREMVRTEIGCLADVGQLSVGSIVKAVVSGVEVSESHTELEPPALVEFERIAIGYSYAEKGAPGILIPVISPFEVIPCNGCMYAGKMAFPSFPEPPSTLRLEGSHTEGMASGYEPGTIPERERQGDILRELYLSLDIKDARTPDYGIGL